jgi:hypothetical protein
MNKIIYYKMLTSKDNNYRVKVNINQGQKFIIRDKI